MTVKTKNQVNYYNGLFSDDNYMLWECAPGKQVIVKYLASFKTTIGAYNDIKIIDIGCGSGYLLNEVKTMFGEATCYGVDFSNAAIDIAKQRYASIDFYCEDGNKTHFSDHEFDVLISYGSYEHFLDPAQGIKEASRILKPGGKFAVMLPSLGIYRTDRTDEGWYEDKGTYGITIKQMQWNFTRDTWTKMFRKAGLTLFEANLAKDYGALNPGVFFLGEKD